MTDITPKLSWGQQGGVWKAYGPGNDFTPYGEIWPVTYQNEETWHAVLEDGRTWIFYDDEDQGHDAAKGLIEQKWAEAMKVTSIEVEQRKPDHPLRWIWDPLEVQAMRVRPAPKAQAITITFANGDTIRLPLDPEGGLKMSVVTLEHDGTPVGGDQF